MPPLIPNPAAVALSTPAVPSLNTAAVAPGISPFVKAPVVPVGQAAAPFAGYGPWHNPLPEQFRKLDRHHALQSYNGKFLEMHPNGVRGVSAVTQFCFLLIYVNNVTSTTTTKFQGDNPFHSPADSTGRILARTLPTVVIQSNQTRKFLCMDDKSVVFQQDEYDPRYCLFHHEYQDFKDRYYRNATNVPSEKKRTPRWYIGVNKDGSIRCGNVTRKNQNGANFNRINKENIPKHNSPSPKFEGTKRKCCPKNKCKRRRGKGKGPSKETSDKQTSVDFEQSTGRSKKRCRHRNWCRRHRRKFFKLTLKNVKRYFNRCIKNKHEIRHCKKR